MPVVQDIAQKEEETFAYHTARGEMSETHYQGVPITSYIPNEKSGYYYKSKKTKRKIVLHYTIGYLGGDLAQLTPQDWHVSVPFVIARNGRIVQLFNPDYWSFHLTPGAVGGNKANSSQSIAIEMTGLGPLEKSGNWMFNYYGSRYCRASETEHYVDNQQVYRKYRYYTKFTEAQYDSLASLLPVLANTYGIPETFLPLDKRFDLFESAQQARDYHGICSHVNFQPPNVKNDIGPAFDWARIGG